MDGVGVGGRRRVEGWVSREEGMAVISLPCRCYSHLLCRHVVREEVDGELG